MTSRAKKLIKTLKKILEQEHLYTTEEIIQYKKQLRSVQEHLKEFENLTTKGFGKK